MSGLRCWFPDEVQAIIRAVDSANHCIAANVPVHDAQLYRAGFRAALQAVATAFDVRLDPMIRDVPVPRLTEVNHV